VALALGLVVVVRIGLTFGPGGGVLVLGAVAAVLWQWPSLRRRLATALRGAALRRWFVRALRACGLVGPLGDLPVVGGTESVPAGLHLSVRVPLGRHTGHLADAGEALAAALRVKEVRVTRDPNDASMANVVVVRRDPLAGTAIPWLWQEADAASLWQPIPIGKDEDGQTVQVNLPEHNLLLGGEPGSGKSAVLSLLVAASALDPDVTLTLLDGKQVELAPWSKCADRFVGPDPAEAIEVLEALRSEMDIRYGRLLAAGKRKIEPEDGLGLHVVAVDELAFYLRGGKRDDRAALTESFRDLVSRGRAAGIVVLAATQKPSHEVIPTWIRDLFSFRLALRCTTPEASDTVLGQGWASQGFSAATIDPAARGVGFLLHEGGVPVKLRAAYLNDADIADLAERAVALRGAR
jgi:hypothetical protein